MKIAGVLGLKNYKNSYPRRLSEGGSYIYLNHYTTKIEDFPGINKISDHMKKT